MELERITTIKGMYDDILIANKKIMGENELQSQAIKAVNDIN